jgi:hypothetical protein
MDSKYENLKRVQHGSLKVKRIKRYLCMYGIGFALWVGHLWDLLLEYLEYVDKTTHHWLWRWTIGLFEDDPPPKVYPIVHAVDTIGLIFFLLGTSYVLYWIYADTYCKSHESGIIISFKKQLFKAIVFNIIIYTALRFII